MTINFPASLDSLVNPTPTDTQNSVTVPHATQHANINDIAEALEAKVGVDGSAVVTSHDYKITANAAAISAETSARSSGDSTNASAISSEATTRASADTSLQSNIDAEMAARAAADSAIQDIIDGLSSDAADITFTPSGDLSSTNVAAALAELDTEKATTESVSSEASARSAADSSLSSSISSESSARSSADSALSSSISTEASTRSSADSALASSLSTEVSDRISGDAASVSTASADATSKANAAQAAAISAAASDATSKANAAAAASLPLHSTADDSVKVGGTTPTTYGKSLIDDVDAAAARTTLGLGTLATQSGTFSGTSSGTNTGDQTSIVGIAGSLAEFNAALTGADFATGGGTVTGDSSGTNTGDQTNISGNAATVTTNANLTGDVTSSGNATTLANNLGGNVRFHPWCYAVAVTNVDTSSPGATLGTAPFAANKRYLLIGQSSTIQNGIWLTGATNSTAMTRPVDWTGSTTVQAGDIVGVTSLSGAADTYHYTNTIWVLNTSSASVGAVTPIYKTVDTDACAFSPLMDYVGGYAPDLASASTLFMNTTYGDMVNITGTTTISTISMNSGQIKILRFTGALKLTHSATSINLPGGAHIQTQAGDIGIFVGANNNSFLVHCVAYIRSSLGTIDGTVDPRFSVEYCSDFEIGATGGTSGLGIAFTDTSQGTAGAQAVDNALATASNPGLLKLTAGTASGSQGAAGFTSYASAYKGITIGTCTLVPTLSTASNEYRFAIGLMQNYLFTSVTDGIYFLYDRLNSGVNWQLVSKASSTPTTRDTGIAVTASSTVFQSLAFVVNNAGTSIQAYVNGVAAGAAITTNIPTAALAPEILCNRLAGTPPAVYVDYYYYKKSFAGR